MKSGYKQSEVGVIPEEWDVQPLSQIVERLEAGVSVNSVDGDIYTCDDSPAVLKTSAVTEGRFFPLECKKIAPYDLHRASLSPRADTIIISRMNTLDLIGESGYVDANYDDLYLPDRLWMTKKRTGVDASIRWLSLLLSSKPQKAQIKELATGTSGSMKNLSKGSLLKLKIAVPAPLEQRAIAEALNDVDALLGALDRIIAKKRDLNQAAIQQLLTGRTRLPGFRGEWETKRIGDFTDCVAGGTPSTSVPAFWGGGYRWMSSGELKLKFVADVEGRITEEGMRNSSTQMIPKKCVLIGLAGQGRTRGTVALNLVELCTNQSIAAIFPSPIFVPEYLYYNLDARYEELRGLSSGGGGRGGLNLSTIKSVAIPLPQLEEQASIAEVLLDMDTELTALKQRRNKTRLLKQGMMQELLTGRTRLV